MCDEQNFSFFKIDQKLISSLKKLKIISPTPVQKKVLSVLEKTPKKNIFVASKTGSGKTLSYGIPIINNFLLKKKETSLIIVPTRELAIQITNTFKEIAKNASLDSFFVVSIVGGLFIEKQIRLLKKHPQVIVSTPGRLKQIMEEQPSIKIFLKQINKVIIDEADRLFEDGHFLDLEEICKMLKGKKQILVFSATLFLLEEETKKNEVKNKIEHAFKTKLYTINLSTQKTIEEKIKHFVTFCKENEKLSLLCLFLTEYSMKTIVFVNSILLAKKNSRFLTLIGFNSNCLHGKIPQKNRLKKLDAFRKNKSIIVCTSVMSRGLDIEQVELVINMDIPDTAREYVHRTGRTARSGRSGLVLDIVSEKEYNNYMKIKKMFSIQTNNFSSNPENKNIFKKTFKLCEEIFEIEKQEIKQEKDLKILKTFELSFSEEKNKKEKLKLLLNSLEELKKNLFFSLNRKKHETKNETTPCNNFVFENKTIEKKTPQEALNILKNEREIFEKTRNK